MQRAPSIVVELIVCVVIGDSDDHGVRREVVQIVGEFSRCVFVPTRVECLDIVHLRVTPENIVFAFKYTTQDLDKSACRI